MIQKHIIPGLSLLLIVLFGCTQNADQTQAQEKKLSDKNKLADEKSPYLLQHADNPVNWYPWGEEAFQKAEEENKLIFLSIGYSTCYWCHVMERQVFENEEIAETMNNFYVSIKVDREERPDVDRIYMSAVRAMTGGGGRPMSVFLTPELKPFFGATYIPPKRQGQRPGFPEVADQVQSAWSNERQKVLDQADAVTEHIREASSTKLEPQEVGPSVIQEAVKWYKNNYDNKFGGFGGAPKFPQPSNLEFLLEYYKQTNNSDALSMVEKSLRHMALGGMYDHIGQGFHRYSTDEQWRVPHFEKMLYDQAQLANIYLKAYEVTGDDFFAEVAEGILTFVDREFTHTDGGFYSALDAESIPPENDRGEKEEGAYYVWEKSEIDQILDNEKADIFNYIFDVKSDGNALNDPHNVFTDKNILYRAHTLPEAAEKFGRSEEEIREIENEIRHTLFEARSERSMPALDDKLILSWNGLMISAYANAYEQLEAEEYRRKAEEAADFLIETLYDSENKIFKRRYRDGEARFTANLEDYAYFVQGLLDLYNATSDDLWLNRACAYTDQQLDLFYDSESGGFFDTTMEDKALLFNTKEQYDGARPSGNSVAVVNLFRLHELTDNEVYRQKADETVRYFGTVLNKQPMSMSKMLGKLITKL